jgi:hypothetical protein
VRTTVGQQLLHHQFRQVDLVAQHVRDYLPDIPLGTGDVAVDEDLVQDGVDDGDEESRSVSAQGLPGREKPVSLDRVATRELQDAP